MPALLVSTAAGIIVTRAGAGTELGPDMVDQQIFGKPRPLMHASARAGRAGPGAGHAGARRSACWPRSLVLARRGAQSRPRPPRPLPLPRPPAPPLPNGSPTSSALDALELEVGHGLLPLIDIDRGGELPGRVSATCASQIATDLGIVLPPVHLRDNLRLEPTEYRIRLRGMEIGAGIAYADRLMVLEPSGGRAPAAGRRRHPRQGARLRPARAVDPPGRPRAAPRPRA